MIHPDTELKLVNPQIGYGVFATRDIPKGTITWVMDKLDRVFSSRQVEKLSEAYRRKLKKYCFRDNKGNHVLCWDLGRYVNHSFKPNCLTTAHDFEVAGCDIRAGEEITNHYGYLNLEPMYLMKDKGEEVLVTAEDLLMYYQDWDEILQDAVKNISKVDQPLDEFLSPKMRTKIRSISAGRAALGSIRHCYFEPCG